MEKKVLSKEEINQLINIKQSFDEIIYDLGMIELKFINLNSKKEELTNQLLNLQQEEEQLIIQLEQKYGKGKISIETGEFTPNEF